MSEWKCKRCQSPVALRGRPPKVVLCVDCGGQPADAKKPKKKGKRRMSAPLVASKHSALIAELEAERDTLSLVIAALRKREAA